MDEAEQFRQWCRQRHGWSAKTADNYSRYAQRAIGHCGDLTEASTDCLQGWLDTMPSPQSRNQARKALRAWYAWLIDQCGHTEDPTLAIESVREPKVAPKALSRIQSRRLLNTAVDDGHPVAQLVGLMLLAGLRVSEAAALQWDHVDERIRVVRGKGAKDRIVPVAPGLADILAGAPRVSPWVIPSGRSAQQPASYGWCYRNLRALGERAGLPRVTPHVCRHSFATSLLRSGVDIVTVATLLGHSDISTTQAYLRIEDHRLTSAVQALDFAA